MIIEPTETIKMCDPDGIKHAMLVACPEAIDGLYDTGCAVPDIKHITFNTGKRKSTDSEGNVTEYPVLVTVIDFADGSKEIVQNSKDDGLQLDANGRPTILSKEIGIAMCFLKRVIAGKYKLDDNDELTYTSAGFGRILTGLIKDSVDQNELKRQQNAARKAKKEEKENKPDNITIKAKAPSLHDCVIDLSQNLKDLKDVIMTIKSDLNK